MFKKLFGGGEEKKPQQAPQQQQAPKMNQEEANKIEIESALHQMKVQEDKIEQKIESQTIRIEKLRNEAKELVRQGKKKAAAHKLNEMKEIEKFIINSENQKQAFVKIRMQLELGSGNKAAATALKNAIAVLNKNNVEDDLQNILADAQEIQMNQQQTNAIFEQMAGMGDNQEDVDDEMAQLEKEIAQESEQQIHAQLNQIPQVNQVVKPQEQQQQQLNKPQAQKSNYNELLAAQLDF